MASGYPWTARAPAGCMRGVKPLDIADLSDDCEDGDDDSGRISVRGQASETGPARMRTGPRRMSDEHEHEWGDELVETKRIGGVVFEMYGCVKEYEDRGRRETCKAMTARRLGWRVREAQIQVRIQARIRADGERIC